MGRGLNRPSCLCAKLRRCIPQQGRQRSSKPCHELARGRGQSRPHSWCCWRARVNFQNCVAPLRGLEHRSRANALLLSRRFAAAGHPVPVVAHAKGCGATPKSMPTISRLRSNGFCCAPSQANVPAATGYIRAKRKCCILRLAATLRHSESNVLILLIVLILVFGFGGYRMGPGLGYYGGGGLSLILTIIVILLLLKVI